MRLLALMASIVVLLLAGTPVQAEPLSDVRARLDAEHAAGNVTADAYTTLTGALDNAATFATDSEEYEVAMYSYNVEVIMSVELGVNSESMDILLWVPDNPVTP